MMMEEKKKEQQPTDGRMEGCWFVFF